jgi:hypothetical protein
MVQQARMETPERMAKEVVAVVAAVDNTASWFSRARAAVVAREALEGSAVAVDKLEAEAGELKLARSVT